MRQSMITTVRNYFSGYEDTIVPQRHQQGRKSVQSRMSKKLESGGDFVFHSVQDAMLHKKRPRKSAMSVD
jgi:hypothetical protein